MTTAGQQHQIEHRGIHDDFAGIINAAGTGRFDPQALTAAIRHLRAHIWAEEEVLFPALRNTGASGQVDVMLREHGEIWSHLDEMEQILDFDEPDARMARTIWGALGQILEQHNRREESVLFANADPLIRAGVFAEVVSARESEMPADWTCAMTVR